MSTTTATGPAESGQDRFDPLLDRLESAVHRLDLAADDLSDLAEKRLPDIEEHGSAAFVARGNYKCSSMNLTQCEPRKAC